MTDTFQSDIAVIGGGFAGAAVAFHAARAAPWASVIVIEPRRRIGGGLAYDSDDPGHRINVPAGRMSLLPDDEDHFPRWIAATDALRDDPAAIATDGNAYPRRGVFGDYVADQLAPLLSAGRVHHIAESAATFARSSNGWRVVTSGRMTIDARIVVIATTHPAPAVPEFARPLVGDPRLIENPLAPAALEGIQASERVLIVGAGLTMADIMATLDRQRHAAPVIAISRHGLRSRGHATVRTEPFGEFASPSPRSSVELLRRVRAGIAVAEAEGMSWHAVLDAVRDQAQTLWPKLPLHEQSRIVRHLRAHWDVHRFRIAPQLEAVIERRIAAGSLRFVSGSVVALRAGRSALEAILRWRGHKTADRADVDRVVLATGPAHGSILSLQPFLGGLSGEGTIKADALGLGIACDRQSRAVGRDEAFIPELFIAGPLARAAFGELMGLPQVSRHAADVAEHAVARLSELSAPPAGQRRIV